MKRTFLLIILFLSLFLWTSNSHALPIVDFAGSAFSAVAGHNSKTVADVYGDLDITFTASPGKALLTHNPGPSGGVDGIGIGDDEISLGQILTVGFSSGLNMSKIYITDLFYEGKPAYQEEGQYRLLIGASWNDWNTFIAPSTNLSYPATNGELEINVDPSLVINAIEFRAIESACNDFSVLGIDPVPEPATMLLLGAGLLGLAGCAVRRRKDSACGEDKG